MFFVAFDVRRRYHKLASCQAVVIVRSAIPTHRLIPGSQCFQQECKATYRTHEPVASNVPFKAPLLAQRRSNYTK